MTARRNTLVTIGTAVTIACLGSGPVVWMINKQLSRARDGWNLTAITVAATDLAPGTPITLKVVSQRSVPQRFAGDRYVPPDAVARVVNSRTRFALKLGTPLRWADVADDSREEVVFFASRSFAPGTSLELAGLEPRVVDRRLITATWVIQRDVASANGRVVTLPIEKGDPVLWSQLAGGAP